MPRSEHIFSKYRGMWIIAMFDLPTKTKKERKRYTKFRKLLLENGFSALQYSIYARFCASEGVMNRYIATLEQGLPPAGEVRLLMVTDRQFEKMINYVGVEEVPSENAPRQLTFF